MVKEYLAVIFLAALILFVPHIITRRIMLKSMAHNTALYKKMEKIAPFLKEFAIITGMSAIGIVFGRVSMNNDYFGAKDVREYICYLTGGLAPILILPFLDKALTWEERKLEIAGAIIGFCICGIILLLADAFWGITDVVLFYVMGMYCVICAPVLMIYVAIKDAIRTHRGKQEPG